MAYRNPANLLCLMLIALGTATFASAQESQTAKPLTVNQQSDTVKNEAAVAEIKVFQLQFLNPVDAVQILTLILGVPTANDSPNSNVIKPRFAVDERTKAVIAIGKKETLLAVEALLLLLDAKPKPAAASTVWHFFYLKNASPQSVQAAIEDFAPEFKVRIDNRTRSVMVDAPAAARGEPADGLSRVEELIKMLDVPMVTAADLPIRVVWLVESSLIKDGADPVPPDLSGSIDALRKKVGLGELRTAAQTIVRCVADDVSKFETSGTTNLKIPMSFEFQGQVKHNGSGRYRLQIRGSTKNTGKETETCQLSTTCASIGIGQPVILGTTAIDSQASVFVVQILEND